MEHRISVKSSVLGKAALIVLMLLFSTTFLKAQTITFAQFNERFGGNDFSFTNNAVNATFQTGFGGSAVTFTYQNITGLPADLQGPQNARVFVTASTTASAFVAAGNKTIQPFNNTFTIQIVRDTPASVGAGPRTNLLTAVINPNGTSNSDLSGDDGANSAAYTASTPNQNVSFSSDFINFSNTSSRNLGLAFSSVTPNFSYSGISFVRSFSAAGAGTFASNVTPIFMIPTAASVTVSGRVLTPKGKGLANARVVLTKSSGETSTVLTNNFGYYEFLDMPVGETAVITIKSRLFAYTPQVLSITDDTVQLNFSPQ